MILICDSNVVMLDCCSTISGEGDSEESESSDSEEDAEGTPEREGSVASSGSGEEEDERIVFSDDTNSAKQSPVKSVPPKDNTDHKMEVDSSDGELIYIAIPAAGSVSLGLGCNSTVMALKYQLCYRWLRK